MATATYVPIATQTLSTSAASITFSSIPSTYTDLRLVLTNTMTTSGQYLIGRFNSDSGTNYSHTDIYGSGSSATSNKATNDNGFRFGDNEVVGSSTTIPFLTTVDIFSYAGSTYKTALSTASADQNGSGAVIYSVQLWRSTAAITSFTISASSGNLSSGTTATLWGI